MNARKMSTWNGFWSEFDTLQKKLEASFSDSSIYKSKDDNAIVIEVPLAGFPKEAITVDLDSQSEFITVVAKTEEKFKKEEIFVGWSDVDLSSITTDYVDGMLTIRIPFAKKELARKVRIMGPSDQRVNYIDIRGVPEDRLDDEMEKAVAKASKEST